MRILFGLVLSTLIDFILLMFVLFAIGGDTGACLAFFVVMSWPLIWFIIIVLQVDDHRPVDMIKMQNYFNLDALRRNSDRNRK